MEQNNGIYQRIVMDHYRNPRFFGKPTTVITSLTESNPLCGDTISIYLEATHPIKIFFEGEGCSLSIAAASMMTELLNGKNIEEAQAFIATILSVFEGALSVDSLDPLGDISSFKTVSLSSSRIECILLAWKAVKTVLDMDKKSL